MTRRASHALVDVNTVIEIDKIGDLVYAIPFNRAVAAETGAHRLERRRIGPNLGMASHAGLGRRNPREGGGFHRRVAEAAIDAQSADVMLVAERHRLFLGHVDLRVKSRANQQGRNSSQTGKDEHRSEDTNLGESIRAAMKYLRHPSPGKPLTQLNEETVYSRRARTQRKESTFIWTGGGSLPRAERGEDAVFVEDFNIRETRFPQQVELEH